MTIHQHCNTPLSNKDKAVIKNLYQLRIQCAEDTDGIFKDKLQKVSTGHFTNKKLEPMLTRCAKAYSSSGSVV